MNASDTKIQAVVESAFKSAVRKLIDKNPECFRNDLFVQIDDESGELQIYDESENLIEKTIIFDWIGKSLEDERPSEKIIAILRSSLAALVADDVFSNPCFAMPFSISLTDENFTVMEELLFLDDENTRIDDPLLKNLDEELDNFLHELLSDVK
jgi:hypothetical protein